MEPGSSLVLFTDGLIERPGELIDKGMAELAARVQEAPDDPEAVCDHLLRTLVPSGGATDDVAILMLRNLPVTDRFRVEFEAEPEALSQMRSLLRRWLRHAGADERTISEVTTAAGEAATNAIEHSGVAAQLRGRRPRRRTARSSSPFATRGAGASRARAIRAAACR